MKPPWIHLESTQNPLWIHHGSIMTASVNPFRINYESIMKPTRVH